MMKRLLFISCTVALFALSGAPWAQASVTLNATYFPDDNFRAALSAYATNGVIDETQLTELDVSNKGITDLTGLGLLTGLTYLDISNNNLTTGANITGLTALKTLKASNCNLVSLAGTTGTSSITHVTGSGLTISANNVNLIYLDISHNPNFYSSGNLQHLTKLETLVMHHCTYFDFWGTPGNYMSSLKYVDVSYCTNMDRIFLPAASGLEVLKAVGLTKLKGFKSKSTLTSSQQYYIVLKHQLATLKWLDVSECSQLKNVYLRYCTNMQHLNASGTKLSGFSSSATLVDGVPTDEYIQLPTGLTTLEYLNLANCSSLNSFRAIKETYNINCIDTLILTNDTNLGWSNVGIEGQTHMTYLDVTNCNISSTGSYVPNFDNLKDLETLLYGENPNVGYLRISGNSNLKTLDLHGNTSMTMLALDNCGLPRTNLSIDGTNCPALTGLKLNNNGYTSVSQAKANATTWGLDNVKFLYLENNNLGGGEFTLSSNDCEGLTGLDLSKNGFTTFNAPALPGSLTALMIGKTPSLERLEMHNNPGITTMAADTVMSEGSGLYLLGNTALHYMDISGTADQPNYFQRIGNNGSLNGVPIDTIKASYNKFYTFRNQTTVAGGNYERWNKNSGVYDFSSTVPSLHYYYYAYWPTSPAQPDSASLEHLTGLKYLDLSHCNLKDSVYLHKNTELRYLDVSHNRTITRYTSSQDKGAGLRAHINSGHTSTSYPDYKKYLWLIDTTPKYPGRQESYDQEYYTMDYNDTTGLYILDLLDNNKLEYLDISYTGIEQTALTHCHVSNARFIWIQDLPELKYFYADYNGMRSMGIGSQNGKKKTDGQILTPGLRSLERLSAIGMRGADVTTMQGSINFAIDTRCKKLHYINLSYSDFDSIGFYASKIDTIIITGNPLHYINVQTVDSIKYIDARACAFKQRGYDPETGNTVAIPASVRQRYQYTNYDTGVTETREKTITMNGAREGGVYTGNLTTPWSGLRGVRAYNREKLATVLLDNCNGLRDVYCHHDPKLPKISGFDNLAYNLALDSQFGYPTVDADSLNLVWVNDNLIFNELDLHMNDNLKYLHAYNDKALGDALGSNGMDLKENVNLVTAWVSNSNLQKFTNQAAEHLDTLKIWQNPVLQELNVTSNTRLRYFDLRNCMVRNLDVSNNTQLRHFDCSNQDSIWTNYDHFNFDMPGKVPTVVNDPGKNSIADLHFGSKVLEVVHADNNDLYCMDGLNNNPNLQKLTYSYNHINGIDLSGCPNITNYNCYHNVRGLIPGELATWSTTENGVTTTHELYYLQLKPNAGDGIDGNDTFLGNKCGQDSLLSDQVEAYQRRLIDDGFDPDKVIEFTVNSSGPHIGTRGQNSASGAPMRADMVEPGTTLDPESFYGKIAIIKRYDRVRNYVYYTYDDGRPNSSSRGGSGFGLAWGPPPGATDVRETTADGMGELTVVSERYYDAAGAEHSEPIDGVNIIVRQMSDGSTQTVKIIK